MAPRDILKRLLESRGIVPEDSADAAECARLLEECEDRPSLHAAVLGRILRPVARGNPGTSTMSHVKPRFTPFEV